MGLATLRAAAWAFGVARRSAGLARVHAARVSPLAPSAQPLGAPLPGILRPAVPSLSPCDAPCLARSLPSNGHAPRPPWAAAAGAGPSCWPPGSLFPRSAASTLAAWASSPAARGYSHAASSFEPEAPLDDSVEVHLQLLKGESEGVCVLSLRRPASRNAIGRVFLSQLLRHVAHLHSQAAQRPRAGPRVLVLASGVPGVFCAGADLKERRQMSPAEAAEFVDTLRSTFSLLEKLPLPTIAAVDGAALGGGLELALACDLRVCGARAEMGLPETGLAIIPGAGGTQRLPRIVGKAKAKELIFTGRRVRAEEALSIGLVNDVAAEGQALARALELARQMLDKGPLALQHAKYTVDRGLEVDVDAGLAVERGRYLEILQTEDRLEGLRAFAEKRKPVYRGV